MVRLTYEETRDMIDMLRVFSENLDDIRMRARYDSIAEKLELYQDFRLQTRLTKERRARCVELVNECRKVTQEYSKTAGDMSLIHEFDKMKKELAVLHDQIGDIEGRLRANVEFAKAELAVVFDRIKKEIIDSGDAKSNAEADRMARVDPRYMVALGDYKDYEEVANMMKNKAKTTSDTRDDIRQSISTARNSIIKEGYNE